MRTSHETLDITFHRINERQSNSTALRDDGVTVRIPGYGPIVPLPHDLAHCIVEQELDLHRGFWGSVAAGAVFPGMIVVSGRRRPHASDRSTAIVKTNAPFVTQAELLVGAFVHIVEHDVDRNPQAALKLLADCQAALRVDPVLFDRERMDHLCAAVRDAAVRWQDVPVGGELQIRWTASNHRPTRRLAVKS